MLGCVHGSSTIMAFDNMYKFVAQLDILKGKDFDAIGPLCIQSVYAISQRSKIDVYFSLGKI